MMLKVLFFIAVLFIATNSLAKGTLYDREKCDKLIGVEKYLVAGSMADESPGGKTYSFNRIVGALENELLGGKAPRTNHLDCVTDLYKKANSDATVYWVGRLSNTTCVGDSGTVPKVKPADCDQKTWDDYQASMNLIEASAARVNKLTNACIDKDGANSCDSSAEFQKIKNLEQSISGSNSDKCCDMKDGSAFRILRSFYTVEFNNTTDADLQKECYKRTRPTQENGIVDNAVGRCIGGAVKGVIESLKKLLSSANTLLSWGTLTELARLVGKAATLDFSGLAEKMGAFFSAIWQQSVAQFKSIGCFTGKYASEQSCQLLSSLVADYFTGAKLVQGLAILSKVLTSPISKMNFLAKEFLGNSPKAQKLMSSVSEASKATSARVKTSYNAVSSTTKNAISNAGAKLASSVKQIPKIRASVAAGVREARIKAAQKIAGDGKLVRAEVSKPPGPNASTVVEAPPTPTIAATKVEGPVGNAGTEVSGVSSGSVATEVSASVTKKLSKGDIDRIRADLEPFKGPTRANRALVKPEDLKGLSKDAQFNAIKKAAAERKAQVTQLSDLPKGHPRKISKATADNMVANINKEMALQQRRLRISDPEVKPVAVAADDSLPGASGPQNSLGNQIDNTVTAPKVVDIDNTGTLPKTPVDIEIPMTNTPVTSSGARSSVVSKTKPVAQALSDIPKVDISAVIPKPLSGTSAKTSSSLLSFVEKTQTTQPSALRSTVYGNKSNWGVYSESLKRHREIEDLFRKGMIKDAQTAEALHNIVATSEKMARGSYTPYRTSYINSPNSGPSTFARLSKNSVAGVMAGQTMSSKQFDSHLDENTSQRYSEDTLNKSINTFDRLNSSPTAVRNTFDNLKTETEILDEADKLRAQIKAVQVNFGPIVDETRRSEIDDMLASIDKERDRALARVKGLPPPIDDIDEAAKEEPLPEVRPVTKPKAQPKEKSVLTPVAEPEPNVAPDTAPETNAAPPAEQPVGGTATVGG